MKNRRQKYTEKKMVVPKYIKIPKGFGFDADILFRAVIIAGCFMASIQADAQVLPLQIVQDATPYNLQSTNGVPLSHVVGTPPGSDGRAPFIPSGTPNQFSSMVSWGGVVSGTPPADDPELPTFVLKRAQVGAPFLNRPVSFLFGSVISAPQTDEAGQLLPNTAEGILYWDAEPFSESNHEGEGYYWSPHAGNVYAVQPGPISITWRKRVPFTLGSEPAYVNELGGASFVTNGANVYLLYTEQYLVSGSPIKNPKNIYWTKKSFISKGKAVAISGAAIGAVNIVYNDVTFPETVDEEYKEIGDSSISTNELKELRTLWTEFGYLNAYNVEGRVFVELLGDLREDNLTREQLGFEIVNVYRQAKPLDEQTELGERILPPFPDTVEEVSPEPLDPLNSPNFAYQHTIEGSERIEYYAAGKTLNQSDLQIFWMEEGVAGIKWPKKLARYKLDWPDDVARYSHYVRPEALTEEEALKTAVKLSSDNVPFIQYQDPFDRPRAKISATSEFYTMLDAAVPAHRTLLRFTSGDDIAFERVYSWLDDNLQTTNFSGTVAAELDSISAYLAAVNSTNQPPPIVPDPWPDTFAAPRLISQTVNVGDRINAPSGDDYQAGHLNLEIGTSYHPGTYIDPFSAGFDVAALGAIIPVNAIPGANQLEAWWFRPNNGNAGYNAGNGAGGLSPIYWPSVIGRYTIEWPSESDEIVLASNEGGGALDSLKAKGSIYIQNDPELRGYNPNEEHAIMSGGTPFATRDDLNITSGEDYSSEPYVLLDYVESDGRPAMRVFKVLREKPEAGFVFDYIVPAGQLLQAPMPLPLLPKPVAGTGDAAVNFNTEPDSVGDLPGNWSATNKYAYYNGFTYKDRKNDFWVYRGPHAGRPDLEAGSYNADAGEFDPLPDAVAVLDETFRYTVHASRQDQYLAMTSGNLPPWLAIEGLSLVGTPSTNEVDFSDTLSLVIEDRYEGDMVTNELTITVTSNLSMVAQGTLMLNSTNGYTDSVVVYSNRPPFLAESPTPTNSFTMRYYYKTQDGFAWPGEEAPPAVGSIVPYLRPVDGNSYVGDGTSSNTPSLNIVYRPVWPVVDPKDSSKPLPLLPYGATLTKPSYNLPGVKDWKTARMLYQQSIASDLVMEEFSAVLHDPTVFKLSDLEDQGLTEIPTGVKTEYYLGKIYFPNLPPHLGKRLFFDPNRGVFGGLVLKGEFKDEILGEDYLQLNLLRGTDLESALALCPDGDPDKGAWDSLIGALAVDVETYYEDPQQPGSYIPNDSLTVPVAVSDVVEIGNDNIPRDSYAVSAMGPGGGYVTMVEAGGVAFTEPGDPVALHVFKVGGDELNRGELKVVAAENPLSELLTFEHTADLGGRSDEFEYEWKIAAPVDGLPPFDASGYIDLVDGSDITRYTLGGAGVQSLGDNWVIMRYRATSPSHPLYNQWSDWTAPKLAEGWIKRVLGGINPFNQRVKDLFNNRVNTDVSILTQAGSRWEGDVALNLDVINDYGLIEIYETVLRRGRSLSIEAGYNYGPANDALLLVAGYLSDLYMMLGNEAWADAANPTIGIGTANSTYGDIATALFSFKGQQASLLDEELAMLRGRDDVLQPGVEVTPVYNRLIWNYTRGIDAGEVIYALNYNIQENPNDDPDGVINAEDAAHMYPQGHGDAYGHYLTAMKGYYSLLMNAKFDWVPRIEAVNILGTPVSVDYQDERKFAAAAAAVARTGQQVFDLTWRKNYAPVAKEGWASFAYTRENEQRTYTAPGGTTNTVTRQWGMDQWASRVGQGGYLSWVVGNAMLPYEDPDPTHEGIQKVDRTTVPELKELPVLADGLQTSMDNAESGVSPLGIPEDSVVFDIDPNVTGSSGETHFEQVYARATAALKNALVAFDDAKDVTRLMRSEQDSLVKLQTRVAEQELAFRNKLIELYGTPYTDDMGPGKTWKQEYDGPDLIHYMYVENPEEAFESLWNYPGDINSNNTFKLGVQDLPADFQDNYGYDALNIFNGSSATNVIEYFIGPNGYLKKPSEWTGQRASPGKIQQVISKEIAARNKLYEALYGQDGTKAVLQRELTVLQGAMSLKGEIRNYNMGLLIADEVLQDAKAAFDIWDIIQSGIENTLVRTSDAIEKGIPLSLIAGLSAGGDVTSVARGALKAANVPVHIGFNTAKVAKNTTFKVLETATASSRRWIEFNEINPRESQIDVRDSVSSIADILMDMQDQLWGINKAAREYEDAQQATRAMIASSDRNQEEREIFRKRSAALVQGYRTRDAAFRIFRNEKLERYKTLFDLAARYSLLAANAYDYETGLLGSDEGRDFTARIIQSRALGVVGADGTPQFAGSNTGDPGLSSALAEMKADWDVVKTRLGFNNPDSYGTTVSLRRELFRLKSDTEGDARWKEILHNARKRDLLEDGDVRRYCMQISNSAGLPVPGIVLEFSTTIQDGYNLFGKPLAGGDHAYSSSSFATKIHAAGIALEGYIGMDDPAANDGSGTSPDDPDTSYLNPDALSATPYIYLIPVGADTMRSPPLGDADEIRSWMVNDVAIPMPFNIGGSDFSTTPMYQSSDTLSEALFAVRKHQAFRPVSDPNLFSPDIYVGTGGLARSQYTSNRLVARSVWNTRWKIVIPGKTLLNDDEEGLNRLIRTLEDVRIHFITYSYSGN